MSPQVATGTLGMDWLPMNAVPFGTAMPVNTDNQMIYPDPLMEQNSLVAYQGPILTGDQRSIYIQANQVEHGPGHLARLDSIRENDESRETIEDGHEDTGDSEDDDSEETEGEDNEDANEDPGEHGAASWGAGGGGVTIR